MTRSLGFNRLARLLASVVLLVYSAGCTTLPGGQKAFSSFQSCFASNMVLAALGGGVLGVLTKKATDSNAAGVAAGVAATATIGIVAWRRCAAAYSTSERVEGPAQHAPSAQNAGWNGPRPVLNLDRLDVDVAGTEDDPPAPEFDLTYFDRDPARKDVKAQFRHRVQIVRFTPGADDKLVLADAAGKPMLDAAGRQIPLEDAVKIPRSRLQWVTIADEGQQDYVEDVVIQQGRGVSYRHHLQIPPRAQLPLPLPVPMRYTLSVDADGMTSTRTVDFDLLSKRARPKRYTASPAVDTGESPAARAASMRALPASSTVYVAVRKVLLFDSPEAAHKVVAALVKGERVQLEDRAETTFRHRQTKWAKVAAENGTTGWVQQNELAVIK